MQTRIPVAIFVDHLQRRRHAAADDRTAGAAGSPPVSRSPGVFPLQGRVVQSRRSVRRARSRVSDSRFLPAGHGPPAPRVRAVVPDRTQISVLHTCELYSNIFGLVGGALASVPVRIGSRRGMVETPAQQRVQRAAYTSAHRVVANSRGRRQSAAARGRAEPQDPGDSQRHRSDGVPAGVIDRRRSGESRWWPACVRKNGSTC